MDRIGSYQIRTYSKYRRNIGLILEEGWKKHKIHSLVEIDVTEARRRLQKQKEDTGTAPSFTAWMVKCVADSLMDHKELNAYRKGRKKIICFDDADIPIPVERTIQGESVPMAYIIRKANLKSIDEINKEIRSIQSQHLNGTHQVLGEDFTPLERFILAAPLCIKKLMLLLSRRNAFLKKKHMGIVGVTSIGMKGRFPGWVIPLGGTTTMLFVIGGITKKPGVVNDTIEIREFLHVTVTVDHDLIDGGPLLRFMDQFISSCEQGYLLPSIER